MLDLGELEGALGLLSVEGAEISTVRELWDSDFTQNCLAVKGMQYAGLKAWLRTNTTEGQLNEEVGGKELDSLKNILTLICRGAGSSGRVTLLHNVVEVVDQGIDMKDVELLQRSEEVQQVERLQWLQVLHNGKRMERREGDADGVLSRKRTRTNDDASDTFASSANTDIETESFSLNFDPFGSPLSIEGVQDAHLITGAQLCYKAFGYVVCSTLGFRNPLNIPSSLSHISNGNREVVSQPKARPPAMSTGAPGTSTTGQSTARTDPTQEAQEVENKECVLKVLAGVQSNSGLSKRGNPRRARHTGFIHSRENHLLLKGQKKYFDETPNMLLLPCNLTVAQLKKWDQAEDKGYDVIALFYKRHGEESDDTANICEKDFFSVTQLPPQKATFEEVKSSFQLLSEITKGLYAHVSKYNPCNLFEEEERQKPHLKKWIETLTDIRARQTVPLPSMTVEEKDFGSLYIRKGKIARDSKKNITTDPMILTIKSCINWSAYVGEKILPACIDDTDYSDVDSDDDCDDNQATSCVQPAPFPCVSRERAAFPKCERWLHSLVTEDALLPSEDDSLPSEGASLSNEDDSLSSDSLPSEYDSPLIKRIKNDSLPSKDVVRLVY